MLTDSLSAVGVHWACAALAESIAVLGLLEPLVVDQGGRLLAGGHRLAAIKLLKDSNRTAYDHNFPGDLVPVRTMGFDAVKDAERAWAIRNCRERAAARLHLG